MIDIASSGCAPTLEIWALAAWTALPTLLLSPIKPSPTDFLIKRIGQRHGLGRKFEFDVWDADQLPGFNKGQAGWVVWRLTNAGSKLLWWLAIGDAITKFDLLWLSTAYQYAGCVFPGEPYCQLVGAPGNVVGQTFGNWYTFANWRVEAQHIFAGNGAIVTPGGYNPSVGYSITLVPAGSAPFFASFGFRLVDLSNNSVIDTYSASGNDLKNGQTHTSFIRNPQTGTQAHSYEVQWFATGGPASEGLITGQSFSAYGGDVNKNLLPDP